MFKVGQEIGDLPRVLPACRTLLRDADSHVQSAYNYMVVLAFVLIPIVPAMFWLMSVFIIPKYQLIFSDLFEGQQPLPSAPFQVAAALSQVQIVLALLFYLGAALYIGGPRLVTWLGAGLGTPKLDWVLYRIPWRRKRMHRDFAAMLGVLLDTSVPEEKAILLAAESTGNKVLMDRAARACERLREGVPIAEAIGQLDRTGEFGWRLDNAFHAGRNFFGALSGWLQSLDARAFRQQQAFGQGLTTALVLYNGLMVALFAIFIFSAFTRLLEEAVLW
jgi:type II secretory pathway component PulF